MNKTMNIEDYYKPGTVKYEMKWPIAVPLPVPFNELPHEMQFYVLFQEWTRRELEGNQMLDSGDHAAAEAIFGECLQRAEQLDVGELKARSYEGLTRVANKMGKREDARKWLKAALAAREE